MQGPVALCDPSDKTTSFLHSVDPKTGSTYVVVANAAVDDYSLSKNCNAFQWGANKASNVSGGVTLVPGEAAMEDSSQLWCGEY